ncbi:MAG: hypothetical protein AAGK14_10180 [Verrucomicrobiota bacterium]
MSKIEIKTHEVRDGPVRLERTLPKDFLGLDDSSARDGGKVRVRLEAQLDTEGSVLVTGKVWARPQVHCGKCAQWVDYPIELENVAILFEKPLPSVLDLTETIRESILLELPMVAQCASADGSDGQPGKQCEVPKSGATPTLRGKETWSALDDIKLEE